MQAVSPEIRASLAALDQTLADWHADDRSGLAAIAEKIEALGSMFGAADMLGMQDICMLLYQNLRDAAAGDGLNEMQSRLLRGWPALVGQYLSDPRTPAATEALIRHLSDRAWLAPISAADVGMLRELLAATAPVAVQAPPATLIEQRIEELSRGIIDRADDSPATFRRLARDLIDVAQSLDDSRWLGFQDLCLLLAQNLQELAAAEQPISDAQRTLLAAWAGLAGKLARQPGNHDLATSLIRNLRDHHWLAPLGEPDAEVLAELFGLPADQAAEGAAPPTPDIAAAPPEARTTAAPPATPEPLPFAAELKELDAAIATFLSGATDDLSRIAENIHQLSQAAGMAGLLGFQDICLLLAQNLGDIAVTGAGLNAAQRDLLRSWPELAAAYLRNPADPAAAEALIDHLSVPAWPSTLTETDAPILRDMLAAAPPAPEVLGLSAAMLQAPPAAKEIKPSPAEEELLRPTPRPVSKELVDMLLAEIGQMADEVESSLPGLANADTAVRADALSQYAVRIERFGNAAQAAELAGLQQACDVLLRNLKQDAGGAALTARQVELLATWPRRIQRYLEALGDRQTCTRLVEILLDDGWPDPLLRELATPLTDLLCAPYLTEEEIGREARPTEARPEDVSLTLPADLNRELLDGFMQELPAQTEELSAAIGAIISGSGSHKDLERAQRVAHTVKGAANTVGIRGIANLTHHMEDILAFLVEHDRMPSRALAVTLQDATDCLEEMCEALGERRPAPREAQAVLQAVLDWINRLEREGAGILERDLIPAVPEAMAPATAAAAEETAETEDQAAMLRVPSSLIDELLRLVGETLILTGQLQERVKQTASQNLNTILEHDESHQLLAELEQQINIRGAGFIHTYSGGGKSGFDTLEFEQYNELYTITHRLIETTTDSLEFNRDISQQLRGLNELLVALGRLQREVQDLVMRARMVPAKNIVPRLQRAVRQTCRLTGKQANLILKGSDTLIDSDIINNLIDPLMHMLRNAVDHGIEPREDRIRKGKDPVGRIELEFAREGALVVVRCRDDGRGLDAEAIRAAAERRGMIAPGLPLGREELLRLILQPGFSTRRETTQTSGRGIGLDVVNNRLAAIKGSMRIETEPDRGALFELRMPASLLTAHGLLVRVRRQTMAISSHGIERIMHPGDGRLIENGGVLQYQVDEELLDTTLLDDLLALPKDRPAGNREERPALLVRDGDLKHVVLVEQVYDTRDLVIKPLGAYLRSVRGIIGATILGDGSVVAVLDLPELIRMPRLKVLEEVDRTYTRMIPPSPPLALVVDDSISARRALAQVLQDAGYQVRTAKDGLEAAQIIEKRRPDIMLVDLEMPRMNGVELTSHVRANPHTRDLPIIVVTSRSTEKHRNLAEAAGADVYLTKPFSEDQLLKHVHDLLERFARTVTSEDTEPGTEDLGLGT